MISNAWYNSTMQPLKHHIRLFMYTGITFQEVENIIAWTQSLEGDDGSTGEHEKQDIACKLEEIEFECERAQLMEYPTQQIITRLELQAMIATEVKNWLPAGMLLFGTR